MIDWKSRDEKRSSNNTNNKSKRANTNEKFVLQEKDLPLHQQKKGIYRKRQRRIGRAFHRCLSLHLPFHCIFRIP